MERVGVAFAAGLTPPQIVQCVRAAEDLGYESAWMTEGHAGDQFSVLTACAVATRRILLGTAISSVFVRSAPTIAMAAATVDHFSNGRLILGLGSSHKVQVEPEHGLVFSRPTERLRDTMEVVRRLLAQGHISYEGKAISIERFDLWFPPLRREIPIYLAGVFPAMLQLCGELAQGAILTWCTLSHARAATAHVAAGARRAGRTESVDVATLLSCAVGSDHDEVRNRMRPPIAMYAARFPRYRRLMAEAGFAKEVEEISRAWEQGDELGAQRLVPVGLIEQITVTGGPEECRERICGYREAGITLPIVVPRVSGPDAVRQALKVLEACAPK
jgi:alkanesulfonate monooxygenase SsuD/methylene tetrahydromethanopterin reductase-like flavin-dependent oxidoreductase (luciferase family)